jgi:hypothetical protein
VYVCTKLVQVCVHTHVYMRRAAGRRRGLSAIAKSSPFDHEDLLPPRLRRLHRRHPDCVPRHHRRDAGGQLRQVRAILGQVSSCAEIKSTMYKSPCRGPHRTYSRRSSLQPYYPRGEAVRKVPRRCRRSDAPHRCPPLAPRSNDGSDYTRIGSKQHVWCEPELLTQGPGQGGRPPLSPPCGPLAVLLLA